jgi:hypothetical protein
MRQVFGKNSARIFKNFQSYLGQTVATAGASDPAGFGGCAAVTAFRAPIYLGSPEKGKSKKEFLILFGQGRGVLVPKTSVDLVERRR